MQAIKQQRRDSLQDVWYQFAMTSSISSNWAFDRLRLYTANTNTKVGLFNASGGANTDAQGRTVLNTVDLIVQQPFHSGEGWTSADYEHDFTFDLSTIGGNLKVAISGVPTGADFTQIYSNPTGYGSTRGKDADISFWYFGGCNPTDYLRLENQPLYYIYLDNSNIVKALHVRVDGTNLYNTHLDKLLIGLNNNGKSNGTLNYSGRTVTVGGRVAYDNLISKGWTITGTPPPIS